MTKVIELSSTNTRYFETEEEMKSRNDIERGDLCICHIDETKERIEHWKCYVYDGAEWTLVAEIDCYEEEKEEQVEENNFAFACVSNGKIQSVFTAILFCTIRKEF